MSGNFRARVGLACFVLGVILLYRLAVLPLYTWLVPVTGLAFLPAFLNPGRGSALVWTATGFFLAGLTWASWHAGNQMESRLPTSLEGQKLEVSGYLCGIAEPGSFGSVRFPFCVTQWHDLASEHPELPDRLRLAWYGKAAREDLSSRLRLTVVLKKPHGGFNPRGFRYESWLFRQNYGATGSIRSLASDGSVRCGIECQYHQWRSAMVKSLLQRVDSYQSGALIASLMLGYRGDLEPAHWQVLKATGTIHLVAISGLHLGLVAVGAGFVFRRLLVWLPERRLSPARFRLLLFSLVCLTSLGYALAAGFSVPTRRALIMVVVACWWVFSARRGRAADGVLLALFLVLITDPLSPLDQGFWLSFGAVTVLTLVFSGMLRPASWWQSLIAAQFAIFALLWPILSLLDQPQPLVGLLVNLVAIPMVSLLIMPAIFMSAFIMVLLPWLEPVFLGSLDLLLSGFWWFLEAASELKLPIIRPDLAVLFGAALVIPLALTLPFSGFRLAVVFSVLLWLEAVWGLSPQQSTSGNVSVAHPEIRVWDVGQGLSVLVRQGDRVLLYDTGPELEGVYSAAESVLVPNLKALGIQRIDALVISHDDKDHSGGIPLLLEEFEIRAIVSGEPLRLKNRIGIPAGLKVHSCVEGVAAFTAKGLMASGWQFGDSLEGNDASCVVILSFNDGAQDLILGGDISAQAEQIFLQQNPELIEAKSRYRVVLAPHHGSKTSSSSAWVKQLAPDLTVFTAGYRHRYGHPHPEVVERYRQAGSRLLNTATSGAIQLVFRPGNVEIKEARQSARFWIEKTDGG